jgi:hypothetical protein
MRVESLLERNQAGFEDFSGTCSAAASQIQITSGQGRSDNIETPAIRCGKVL